MPTPNVDPNEKSIRTAWALVIGSVIKSPDQYSSFLKSDQEPHLFLIADGLGGHDDGELASHFAIGYISNEFNANKPFDINSAISSVHTKLTMDGRHSSANGNHNSRLNS